MGSLGVAGKKEAQCMGKQRRSKSAKQVRAGTWSDGSGRVQGRARVKIRMSQDRGEGNGEGREGGVKDEK